jgi:hypothetical protein
MSSILTSVVEIEPLKTTSLPKPILAIDNSPTTTKDEQDSGYSLRDSSKDKSTLKDHSTKTSYTNNTQPTLIKKDTDFLTGVLFLKRVLK